MEHTLVQFCKTPHNRKSPGQNVNRLDKVNVIESRLPEIDRLRGTVSKSIRAGLERTVMIYPT